MPLDGGRRGRHVDWFIVDHYALRRAGGSRRRRQGVERIVASSTTWPTGPLTRRAVDQITRPPPIIATKYAVPSSIRGLDSWRSADALLASREFGRARRTSCSDRVRQASASSWAGRCVESNRSVALQAMRRHAAGDRAGPSRSRRRAATRIVPSLLTQAERWTLRAVVYTDMPDLARFFARHDLQIGAGGGDHVGTMLRRRSGTSCLSRAATSGVISRQLARAR